MLRSLNELSDFWIKAADGDLGAVHDFFVDDRDWTIKHVVVDTGNWLPGKKVVLAPDDISSDNWRERNLRLRVTKDELRSTPGIEERESMTRQIADRLKRYLRLPASIPEFEREFEATRAPTTPDADAASDTIEDEHPHLHSVREITRLQASGVDGPLGQVRDLLCDVDGWRVRYLVINEEELAPGQETTVSPRWIENVDWMRGQVRLGLTQQEVRTCPRYHHPLVDAQYEAQLVEHYGREP